MTGGFAKDCNAETLLRVAVADVELMERGLPVNGAAGRAPFEHEY